MPAPRQHLPAPRTPFIGRERDVADLISLLHTVRMVTLTGSGGIGKTRLALRVAEQERSRFADGMLCVDLSAATAGDHVLYSIAQALGIETARGQSLHEAVLLALRSCELLLVLDTCDRIVAPLADLCRSLLRTCPRLRLLATSREPLRIPGENVWRVPPLDLPPAPPKAPVSVPWSPPSPGRLSVHEAMRSPAVRLFAARAHQARPGFTITPETVDTVVRSAGSGRRLAIELAAAGARAVSRADPAAAGRPLHPAQQHRPAARRQRPCGPWWSGATPCSPTRRRPCCGACRSSRTGRWTWPRTSSPPTSARNCCNCTAPCWTSR